MTDLIASAIVGVLLSAPIACGREREASPLWIDAPSKEVLARRINCRRARDNLHLTGCRSDGYEGVPWVQVCDAAPDEVIDADCIARADTCAEAERCVGAP